MTAMGRRVEVDEDVRHGGRRGGDLALYLAVAFGTTWLVLAFPALAGPGGSRLSDVLHLLGGAGPVLGAGVASRSAGLGGEWWAGLRRIPGGPWPWAMALGVPAALLGLAHLAAGGGGGAGGASAEPLAWGIAVSVAYAVLEEPGWRGYLLPRLQARHGALAASVLLGVVHALWHAPMFFYRYPLSLGSVLGFSTSLIAATVFFTHLYNRSGGSVLVTVAFHAAWNLAILVGGRGSQQVAAIMSMGLFVLAGAVLIRYGAARLARQPAVRLPAGRPGEMVLHD